MKIIKKADTANWKYKFTCSNCETELEAEASDLNYHVYNNGVYDRGPTSEEYKVKCLVCNTGKVVPINSIPRALQYETQQKSKK